jgi:thioredoxin 1
MAEPDQPKKETVRIELPRPPVTPPPPNPSVNPRETVRIQLPVRETGSSPVPSSPQSASEDISSTNFFPAPKPPAAPRPSSAPVRPPPIPPSLGPKNNGAVLDAPRHVCVDFDNPDLDVFFLVMENSATITLNESNFDRELTQDDKPMIVDFWAEWCGPCKMIAPMLDEIAREKAGEVKIAKVNVDDNQSLSFKYNIRAIPALLFFKNGQLRDQIIGVTSKKDLLSRLEALA